MCKRVKFCQTAYLGACKVSLSLT